MHTVRALLDTPPPGKGVSKGPCIENPRNSLVCPFRLSLQFLQQQEEEDDDEKENASVSI